MLFGFFNWGIVSCFTVLYNKVNQLHGNIYPLPLEPPCPSPHPTLLRHYRAPSWAPCAIHRLPTSFLIDTWWCTYVNAALSVHPTLPFHLCVHKSLLYICVFIPALQIGSSVPFFRLYVSLLHLDFLDEIGSNIVSRMCFFFFHRHNTTAYYVDLTVQCKHKFYMHWVCKKLVWLPSLSYLLCCKWSGTEQTVSLCSAFVFRGEEICRERLADDKTGKEALMQGGFWGKQREWDQWCHWRCR